MPNSIVLIVLTIFEPPFLELLIIHITICPKCILGYKLKSGIWMSFSIRFNKYLDPENQSCTFVEVPGPIPELLGGEVASKLPDGNVSTPVPVPEFMAGKPGIPHVALGISPSALRYGSNCVIVFILMPVSCG